MSDLLPGARELAEHDAVTGWAAPATAREAGAGPATALAEPPQPPTTPPGAVAGGAPRPRRKRTGLVIGIVAALVAAAFLAVVVYLVLGSMRATDGSAARTRADFAKAMKKAGVKAAYPGQPVALTSVVPSGSHPFSATFTAGEIAALLNTFRFESDVAGMRISLGRVRASVPEPGSAKLSAMVTANGGTYSGTVELPLSYSAGGISSPGVSVLTVEGISANEGQKAQVGGALVDYFNEYLSAAPGLSVELAAITADGVRVTGTAPDSLAYP